jgi:hypothetical protein
MAMAGVTDLSKLDDAIFAAKKIVENMLNK